MRDKSDDENNNSNLVAYLHPMPPFTEVPVKGSKRDQAEKEGGDSNRRSLSV